MLARLFVLGKPLPSFSMLLSLCSDNCHRVSFSNGVRPAIHFVKTPLHWLWLILNPLRRQCSDYDRVILMTGQTYVAIFIEVLGNLLPWPADCLRLLLNFWRHCHSKNFVVSVGFWKSYLGVPTTKQAMHWSPALDSFLKSRTMPTDSLN